MESSRISVPDLEGPKLIQPIIDSLDLTLYCMKRCHTANNTRDDTLKLEDTECLSKLSRHLRGE